MDRKVLVFGWYGQQNIGDEAFCDSFHSLFPEYHFTFVSRIPKSLKGFDAMMVGGGSFLDQSIPGWERVNVPLAFVGVGLSNIHPDNQPALDRARIVVARNKSAYRHVPDLVFAQPAPERQKPDRICVLLNNHFSPSPGAPEWKIPAWDWFCVEFAQTCDRLIDQYQCPVWFVPMCTAPGIDDRRAAAYVVDRMRRKNQAVHVQQPMSRDQVAEQIASSHLVLSQRFHGLVFSILSGVPFIAISGHSKIENLVEELQYGGIVNYYGYSMLAFREALVHASNTQTFQPYVQKAKQEWSDMSVAIKTALFG